MFNLMKTAPKPAGPVYASEVVRVEDMTEAHLEFIRLNWCNPTLTIAELCRGVVTYKGMARPRDLKRAAVRLALPPRPRLRLAAK
jgi:predicted nucleic acid-binding protein